jgi:hypothetical protein
MIPERHINAEKRVWVVFTGESDLPWLYWLRSGFRHCFVVMNDGARWISIDPLSHRTEIVTHDLPPEFDLPRWLESRGHRALKTCIRAKTRPAPLMLFTCVEAVKRILGIHNRFIFTPFQLYRYLNKQIKKYPTFQPSNLPAQKGVPLWEV